jgi:signal transduction histidine kinase
VAGELPLVTADNNRLMQILLNLFGNAIKFTQQGRVQGRVRPRDAGVEIAIADTGIGISEEALPRIFDEFRQADSGTTRRFGGTGLGLAIAKRLVEMHGGTIAVESTVGVGSTFTVWLPEAGASPEREVDDPIGMTTAAARRPAGEGTKAVPR